jgi:VanZ family protein
MTYLRWILWALTIAYWITLFVFTHLPPDRLPHANVSDKLEHFLAYGLLSGMVGLTLWVAFPTRKWVTRLPLLVIVGAAAYGAFDELTQPLTRRTADIHDWFADCAGALAAAVVLFVLQRMFSSKVSARLTPSASPLA